jgi:hypothetical protein
MGLLEKSDQEECHNHTYSALYKEAIGYLAAYLEAMVE